MIKVLLLSLFTSFSGQPTNDNIDTYLSELHEAGKLNGNVLVIKEGKTIYEKSFGYADGAKSLKLNKDHRFNIGSVYKEFPAASIMQLQEKNLLELDDKISKYLLDLPKWSEKVTIQQLLQYSSGLPKIGWNAYFSKGINVNDDHILNEIQNIETLEFEPGTDYLYSNNNPILLIKIVESITQLSFKDYLEKNILIPFELQGTVIKSQYPYVDTTLMASPFNADFEEDNYNISVKSLLFNSTASDLANWFEHLGNFKVLSEQSVRTLSEVAKEGDNIQSPLGSSIWENNKIIEHTHHGSSGNYECLVRRFKQDGIIIVILTNQKNQNVYDISDTIYEIVKKE